MNNIIKETNQAISTLQSHEGKAVPYSPAHDIELSLVGLLKDQIDRLKESDSYISALKDAILARLPEATFMEAVDALSRAQASNNSLMEKILSPVIPKAGSTAPLLEQADRQRPEDEIASQANKETLQALAELTKFVKTIKGAENGEIDPKDEIKKALNL